MTMDSLTFLMKVWEKQCKPGDYVALSAKGSGWSDTMIAWGPNTRRDVAAWLEKTSTRNQYFCPLPFTTNKRDAKAVRGSRYLWADIDEGNWARCKPSVLWESSPGRYAGLWLMPEWLTADAAADGSRKLAYACGFDRGGWDLTQVLRIPGTKNLKYVEKPTVTLKHFTDDVLKQMPVDALEKWRKKISRKLLKIIEGPAEVGKRSDMLWYLEHELCDLGIPLRDVITILKDSDWNKYRGRHDEGERFKAEMDKIRADRQEKKAPTKVEPMEALQITTLVDLLKKPSANPGWLVKDWWMRHSHGIVAGEPKSFKSTMMMDMAMSVVTGAPFLGQYEVHHTGPVLMVQNENSDWIMKDRAEKMMLNKAVVGRVKNGGAKLSLMWPSSKLSDFLMINQEGFMMDDIEMQDMLEEQILRIKPALVIFDPLYLMFNGDISSAKDLQGVLQWALHIKQDYRTAVALIHHYSKNSEGRGGQRMLGSTTLHGWIESAWYLQVQEPNGSNAVVTMEREFRGAGIYPKMDVELEMGEWGDPTYNLHLAEHVEDRGEASQEEIENQIIAVISTAADLLSINRISKNVGISRDKTERHLDRLVQRGQVFRKGERYGIPRP